jgi:hypothetical protein
LIAYAFSQDPELQVSLKVHELSQQVSKEAPQLVLYGIILLIAEVVGILLQVLCLALGAVAFATCLMPIFLLAYANGFVDLIYGYVSLSPAS